MGCKALETTHNINNTFGPGTSNKHTAQQWFQKFCKGDKNLADEEHSGWSSEFDNNELRAFIEVDPLTTTREVVKSQHRPFCGRLAFEANWKGEKLNKWVPCELASSCHLDVSSLILPKNK